MPVILNLLKLGNDTFYLENLFFQNSAYTCCFNASCLYCIFNTVNKNGEKHFHSHFSKSGPFLKHSMFTINQCCVIHAYSYIEKRELRGNFFNMRHLHFSVCKKNWFLLFSFTLAKLLQLYWRRYTFFWEKKKPWQKCYNKSVIWYEQLQKFRKLICHFFKCLFPDNLIVFIYSVLYFIK